MIGLEQTQILKVYQVWPSHRNLGPEDIFFIYSKKFELCSYIKHFIMKSTVNTICVL